MKLLFAWERWLIIFLVTPYTFFHGQKPLLTGVIKEVLVLSVWAWVVFRRIETSTPPIVVRHTDRQLIRFMQTTTFMGYMILVGLGLLLAINWINHSYSWPLILVCLAIAKLLLQIGALASQEFAVWDMKLMLVSMGVMILTMILAFICAERSMKPALLVIIIGLIILKLGLEPRAHPLRLPSDKETV